MINDTRDTNTSHLTSHLSEDQINDALIGEISDEARLHLDACALCQAEVEPFQATLASFNQASAAWSQARSHTLNRDLSDVRPARRFTPAAICSCASALVVAAAIVFSSGLHHVAPADSAGAPAGLVADNSAARESEIAADNAMLGAIDSELQPATPPLALVASERSPSPRQHHAHGMND